MSSNNKSLEKIFDKLVNDGKIKEGMVNSKIIKMISEKFGKSLTSSEEKHIKKVIRHWNLKKLFLDNLDEFDSLENVYEIFEDSEVLDNQSNSYKDDKEYLKELYNQYKGEEDLSEEFEKLKVSKEEKEEIEKLAGLSKILKKLGITDWDTDESNEFEYYIIKSGIDRKSLKNLIGKTVPKVEDFQIVIGIKGSKLFISYSNEDQGVEETNILIKPTGDLLKLYNELKDFTKNERKLEKENDLESDFKNLKVEDEDEEEGEDEDEEEIRDEKIRLNNHSIEFLKELVNKVGNKEQKEMLKAKKNLTKDWLVIFILLQFFENEKQKTKYYDVIGKLEKDESKRSKNERESEDLETELYEYDIDYLLRIIEENKVKQKLSSKDKKNKQALISFIISYIGPDYKKPSILGLEEEAEKEEDFCRIGDEDCKRRQKEKEKEKINCSINDLDCKDKIGRASCRERVL